MIWLKLVHCLAFVAIIYAAEDPIKPAEPKPDAAAVPVPTPDAVPKPDAAAVPVKAPDAVPSPGTVDPAAAPAPTPVAAEPVVDEKDVIVLSKANFSDIVKKSKLILVEFYAPWCGHCKALVPEYAKAATQLAASNPDIKLAKLDATLDEELARGYGVQGFPTMKLFREGSDVPIDYNGGRTTDDITKWLKKKTEPPAKSLTTNENVTEFVASAPVVVVGYFEDDKTPEAKAFLTAADSIDEFPVGIVNSADVASKQEVKNGNIVQYKKFDDGKIVYDGNATDSVKIRGYLVNQSLPLISQLNVASTQKIFGGHIQEFVLLFVSAKAEHIKNHTDAIKAIAAEYRGQLLFVEVDVDQKENLDMSEYFNLKSEDIPAVRIVKSEPDMERYVPVTNKFTPENIKAFIVSYLKGDIKKEDTPQEGDPTAESENVVTLTADNFNDIVMDTNKDVFVEFYAPWCGHCKELVPIWEQLGNLYKPTPGVVIAKIDATEHKIPNLEIEGFPTLKLFRRGDNQVYDYQGERNLVALYEWVEGFNEERDAEEDEEEGADDEAADDADGAHAAEEGDGEYDADAPHDDGDAGQDEAADGAYDDAEQDDQQHHYDPLDDGAQDVGDDVGGEDPIDDEAGDDIPADGEDIPHDEL